MSVRNTEHSWPYFLGHFFCFAACALRRELHDCFKLLSIFETVSFVNSNLLDNTFFQVSNSFTSPPNFFTMSARKFCYIDAASFGLNSLYESNILVK